jgi:hypothetical protein
MNRRVLGVAAGTTSRVYVGGAPVRSAEDAARKGDILTQKVLLRICRVPEDDPQVTPEWIAKLRLVPRLTVPVYHFSETHYLPDVIVTPAYRGTLFNLTGKVNGGAFKGFAVGECLFLGAAGAKRGSGDWEITFRFAASPNVANLTIGDITGVDKKGWEYLWVRYADRVDDTAKALVKKPVAAYVERVYEYGDFGLLGI